MSLLGSSSLHDAISESKEYWIDLIPMQSNFKSLKSIWTATLPWWLKQEKEEKEKKEDEDLEKIRSKKNSCKPA